MRLLAGFYILGAIAYGAAAVGVIRAGMRGRRAAGRPAVTRAGVVWSLAAAAGVTLWPLVVAAVAVAYRPDPQQ